MEIPRIVGDTVWPATIWISARAACDRIAQDRNSVYTPRGRQRRRVLGTLEVEPLIDSPRSSSICAGLAIDGVD